MEILLGILRKNKIKLSADKDFLYPIVFDERFTVALKSNLSDFKHVGSLADFKGQLLVFSSPEGQKQQGNPSSTPKALVTIPRD